MTDAIAEPINVPDGITPKIGWRLWRWSPRDGLLHSIYQSHITWPPGNALRAQCNGDGESIREYLGKHGVAVAPEALKAMRTPVESCVCGIYAVDKVTRELVGLQNYMSIGETAVLGRVALWGTVIIGANGYRGEFAYPQVLYVPDRAFDTIAPRLRIYSVPVLKWSAQREVSQTSEIALNISIGGTKASAAVASAAASAAVAAAIKLERARGRTRTREEWIFDCVLTALYVGVGALQMYSIANSVWWGVSGHTDLRLALGGLWATVVAAVLLFYVHQVVKLWR